MKASDEATERRSDEGNGATPMCGQAVPPRFWWLKRLTVAAVVYVVALVGLRVWWGHEADRRLNAKIAEYRAAGEPVLPEDFAAEPIPDEENAAYYLKQAAAQLPSVPIEVGDFLAATDQHAQLAGTVRQFVEGNSQAFQLLHNARTCTRVDWQLDFTSVNNYLNSVLPSYGTMRNLAKGACLAALRCNAIGDDSAAIENLRDGLAIAERINQAPCLLSVLVSAATDALVVTTIEASAHQIHIEVNESASTKTGQPATRTQVEALIRQLLDEQSLCAAWADALYAERMFQVDTVRAIASARLSLQTLWLVSVTPPPSTVDVLAARMLGPAWKLDGVQMMLHTGGMAESTTARTWPQALARMPTPPAWDSVLDRVSHMLSKSLLPSLDAAVRRSFHVRAERRMAATALAFRLYELDHGSRPTTLAQLVPDYLPDVPRDPFSADDAVIVYRPNATPPVLYSVGANGVDDGGTPGVGWNAPDLLFFLDGDRPAPAYPGTSSMPASPSATPSSSPTSSQAVDDQDDVEQAERDEESE